MNVFMGYNPLVAKQVKVSVWVKEIDGAEPILPATPKDGDCFIVFDTDDDVLADNPSLKKSYANGSWGDAGGGGGGGGDLTTATMTIVNNRSDDLQMVPLNGSFALADGEESASFYEVSATKGTPIEASVILYKGKGAVFLNVSPSTINVTLDGDITSIGDGMYLVTGDCTLTVADKE